MQSKVEVLTRVKRKAEEHPEQPPAQLLCKELAEVPTDVLSHLPKREVMRHSIRHNMPTNPRMLEELEDIPEQYQRTLQAERFLMVDSQQMEGEGRVLIFATQKILNGCSEVVPGSSMEPSRLV